MFFGLRTHRAYCRVTILSFAFSCFLIGCIDYQSKSSALYKRLQQSNSFSDQKELIALVCKWTRKDPLAASKWGMQVDEALRFSILPAIAEEWANRDIKAAVKWVESIPDIEDARGYAFYAVATVWAEKKPEEAARWAETSAEAFNTVDSVAAVWAKKNPEAAVKWANHISDIELRTLALSEAAKAVAEKNPEAAMNLAETLPSEMGRRSAICEVISVWAYNDHEAAVKWLEGQPEGERRASFVTSMLVVWDVPVGQKAKWIEGLPPGKTRDAAIINLSYIWVNHTSRPEDVAKWGAKISKGEWHANVYGNIASGCFDQSQDIATKWAENLPENDAKLAALKAIISKWAIMDPDKAVEWAEHLRKCKYKDIILENIFRTWLPRNPEAAREQINKSSLPEEKKIKLLMPDNA